MSDTIEEQEEGLCMDNFVWDETVRSYRFENTTEGHFKFYEIDLLEDSVDEHGATCSFVAVCRYGSMKTNAHVTEGRKGFNRQREAEEFINKTINKRILNGYKEV